MELNALGTGKLITLMIFGGLFALVGLWLMVRPRADTGRSKIELFGLKFESSSAGVLVFLFGAAFLALPVFVEERVAPVSLSEPPTPAPDDNNPDSDSDLAKDDIPFRTPTVWRVEGEEKEPNNSIPAANSLPLGGVVSGTLNSDDHDFFHIAPDQSSQGDVVVTLSGYALHLQIYDGYGEQIFSDQHFGEDATTFRGPAANGPYVARALCSTGCSGGRSYQISAALRPAG